MSPHRRQLIKPATFSLKRAIQWLSVTAASYIALVVALGAPNIFGHQIEPGEIAGKNYIAHKRAVVIDPQRTRQAQDEARERLVPVFKRDEVANQSILLRLRLQLDEIQKLQTKHYPDEQVSPDSENQAGPLAALDHELANILPPKDYSSWRAETEKSAKHFLSIVEIFPESTQHNWSELIFEFLPEKYSPALRQKTAAMVAASLQPNMTVDQDATKQKVKAIIATTPPVMKQVDTGTVLINKGDQLTPEDVALLAQMGITQTHDVGSLALIATALLAAFCLFGLFLYTFEPVYFYSPSAIGLMATVCVVTCGIAAAVGHEYPQFVSLPATALVLTVVFGRRVSAVLALLVILFLRVSDLVDPAHIVALGAATGVALSVNITKRKELMLAGVLIGVVQAIGYFAAVMVGKMPGSAIGVGQDLVQNLLGGLSSSIVAIGSLPFLEILFGVLTPFRIAELSEPDQPLLRQLEENAPGTYQHSLAVANLAEAGAKAIGADVNLVRAGAMYHDIGKMVTPRFFIENQLGDKNPHDEITPEESRAKVLAHVTNGMELAHKYGLPQEVQDFIPEHQGTTIMAYFYHKACVRDGAENVKESDYRYPGPKPHCKETAIVMLADVSEAVTHSMRDPSQEEVEIAIGNVFKARWEDGQFNESDLTEQELEKVKQAFVRVWRTLHHERLKYPSTTTGRMPVPPSQSGSHPVSTASSPATASSAADSSNEDSGPTTLTNPVSTLPLPPGADCC